MIEVVRGGALTTIQDGGRPGLAHLGVPPSGAADRASLELANRLVGNPPGAPGLELTLIGPRLRFLAEAIVALAGATVEATVAGRPIAMHAPQRVLGGEVLELGAAADGLRSYLAVRGGVEGERVLGSRSFDLLTGLGPPPLRAGERLRIGRPSLSMPGVDVAPVPPIDREPVLHLVLGPRAEWFRPQAVERLLRARFSVTGQSNRIGVRLEGPALEHACHDELLSEGVMTGSLQVPPDGQPIVLLNDHPTTGGYPVIAVVVTEDLGRAAQLRPGDAVRFAAVPAAR